MNHVQKTVFDAKREKHVKIKPDARCQSLKEKILKGKEIQ